MTTPVVADAPAEHKDRRVGCILFGALEIALGALCLLLVLLMLLAAGLAGGSMDARQVALSIGVYGLLSVCFVWLGVGSILCRRWARTLLLVLAWSWLVAGVVSAALLAVLLPRMVEILPPGGPRIAAIVTVLGFVGLFLVVLPCALVLFYQSRHVQATVEARDPLPRWTDACPLPVLTTALWFAYGAVSIAGVVPLYGSVVPVFGRLLSGPPATGIMMLMAAVWLWLAWAFYRLQTTGLWASMAFAAIWFVSGTVTFMRVDFLEIYRLMDYPEAQVEAIRQMGVFSGSTMAWFMGLIGVATIAFLLWLRRYFPDGTNVTTAR